MNRLIVLLFMFFLQGYVKATPIDEIVQLLTENKINALVQHFDENVIVNIYGKEEQYSKSQAIVVVKDFFKSKRVEKIRIENKTTRNGTTYLLMSVLINQSWMKLSLFTHINAQQIIIKELMVETR